ncbi:hypothetical protein ACNOYE_38280 [Nannocystaceae bacterium ST9]
MRSAVVVGLLIALVGCEQPPPGKVYTDRSTQGDTPDEDPEFTATAHREAYARMTSEAIAPLRLADPIAAAQLGDAPLAAAPISLIERRGLASALEPVWSSVGEIDEQALAPDEVIVIRTIRFALGRIHDEVQRRPQVRIEPLAAVRAQEQLADEIEYRLIQAECAQGCASAMVGLADELTSARQQLAGASLPATREAATRARALAERLRGLATRGELPGLVDAAAALEADALVMDALAERLPGADTLEWSTVAPPVRTSGIESVRRMPGPLGERALTRLLGVEERIDMPLSKLWAQTKQHAARWQRLRAEMIVGELPEEPALPIDLARCTAARERIAAGLAMIPEIDPPKLDCARWLKITGERAMRESELVLALLDAGWIEPQRRRLRGEELEAVALIGGQWSPDVHRHLRRVMLLARLDEPHARARALDEGRAALCLAGAALWIHAQLGPSDELRLMLGDDCALIGDADVVQARVLADPRGAMAGLGLSLIGDEPAAMAGFDRFWWAPLGLMRLLATPPGTHPDQFKLPSEQGSEETGEPEIEVKIEELDANMPLE